MHFEMRKRFWDISTRTAGVILIGIVFAVIGGLLAFYAGSSFGFQRGYKAAFSDYQAGTLECVVKVRYPEWLQDQR